MHAVLIGNLEPQYSTENDLLDAMQRLDWDVRTVQSGDVAEFENLLADLRQGRDLPDRIIWVRTASLWDRWGSERQWKLLAEARRRNVPVIGYHLDRWWGLNRQYEIADEPFFHCDLLITADGGHDDEWEKQGINHVWFPPAVSERWCVPGEFKEELATDIVFAGSWQGGYHREWGHRAELVAWLQKTYGDRVAFYPKQGQHAVRGLALNDVYWSAKVVVGDSCLAPKVNGTLMTSYTSDRMPETVGRGGVLVHPHVEGVTDGEHYREGRHLRCWELGDWDGLRKVIDELLDDPEQRERIRVDGMDRVRREHTYTRRMQQLDDLLDTPGMLDA